jgi:hypothetical protein
MYGALQMEHEALFRYSLVDSSVSSATNEDAGEGEPTEEYTLLGILRSEMRKLCDAED